MRVGDFAIMDIQMRLPIAAERHSCAIPGRSVGAHLPTVADFADCMDSNPLRMSVTCWLHFLSLQSSYAQCNGGF